MNPSDQILKARNALCLYENLLMEAYLSADEGPAKALKALVEHAREHREVLTTLYMLVSLHEGDGKAPCRKPRMQ